MGLSEADPEVTLKKGHIKGLAVIAYQYLKVIDEVRKICKIDAIDECMDAATIIDCDGCDF